MTERCSTTATGTNLSSNVAYHLSTVQNFTKNYFFMFQKSVLVTLFTRTWEPRIWSRKSENREKVLDKNLRARIWICANTLIQVCYLYLGFRTVGENVKEKVDLYGGRLLPFFCLSCDVTRNGMCSNGVPQSCYKPATNLL